MKTSNIKITISKAANGYIARLNDNQSDVFVFKNEDEVSAWFQKIMLEPSEPVLANGDKKWR